MTLRCVACSLVAACVGCGAAGDGGESSSTGAPGTSLTTPTSEAPTGSSGEHEATSTGTGTSADGTSETGEDPDDDPKFDLGSQADAAVGTCQEIDVVPMPQRPNVALVLDYSSSMQNLLGDKSRWAALWGAVDLLIAGWDAQLNLGMMTFPDLDVPDYNSCVTEDFEVPVAPMNGANILAVLPGADFDPPGNTPTRSGVLVAADHLETLDPDVPRAIFLVTDGDALCGPGQFEEETDQGVDEVIGQIYSERGIPVYVIGLAAKGDAFIDHLNEMGLAGGAADPSPDHDYYPGDDPASLQAAFEQVAIDVITCVLDLEQAPGDPAYFKVQVDGVEYEYVADCGQGDGWAFVPGSMNKQIELCGAACLAFEGGAAFHAKQYCPNG
jgi:hypothetical protein